jgi:hydroxymethylbilane synthase
VKSATVKVGTRGSALALAQTELLLKKLREIHPHVRFVVVPIKTAGDRITSAAELRTAGKGLFVKEIERALLARKVSIAVHSLKDLPSELPEGLILGAVPEREDASDAFIGRTAVPIEKLPPGSVIGTSSLRRQAILKSLLPHLQFVEMKGNLDTRLAKLRNPRSTLAGIVVAAAGLRRLYPNNGIPAQLLPPSKVVPAAGQGALAVEIREADEAMKELLAPIHHPVTAACIRAERELQRRLEGGCQVPLGAYAEASDDGLIKLTACLATLDGRRVIRESQSGVMDDPLGVAEALETLLVSHGAREILETCRPRPSRASARPHRNGQARRPKARRQARPRRKARSRR